MLPEVGNWPRQMVTSQPLPRKMKATERGEPFGQTLTGVGASGRIFDCWPNVQTFIGSPGTRGAFSELEARKKFPSRGIFSPRCRSCGYHSTPPLVGSPGSRYPGLPPRQNGFQGRLTKTYFAAKRLPASRHLADPVGLRHTLGQRPVDSPNGYP